MSIIKKCLEMAPMLKEVLGEKWVVALADKEKYLFYQSGELDFKIQPGDKILAGTIIKEAMEKKQKVTRTIDQEHSKFGFGYMGIATPLIEEGEVKGAFVIIGRTINHGFVKIISDISARFISDYDVDSSINVSLQEIAELSSSASAVLFLYNKRTNTMEKTYEWLNEEASSQLNIKNQLPCDQIAWLMKKLCKENIVFIENLAALPPEAEKEKGIFQQQNIQSMLAMPIYSGEKFSGFLSLTNYYKKVNWNENDTALLRISSEVIGRAIEKKQNEKKLYKTIERLEESIKSIIYAMTKIVEIKDPYTSGHQWRVAELSKAIAEELGLPSEQITGIHFAAAVHDIGKVCIPSEILSKPGRITADEFNIIKNHSQVGYDILENIVFPWPIDKSVLQHHEKINGSGYPAGLTGNEIILEAKIIGVADVVEAMSSRRPYRDALGIDAALEEIVKNKDILYDGNVVTACLKLFRENRINLFQ